MLALQERYLNPFTDFGFKKLFGEEANKTYLIDFLNTLLDGEQSSIAELQFMKNEHIGRQETDRRAIFDIYCTNQEGEHFIVELQKSKQKFFKDRSLYYATFPIQEQGLKGIWDFELKAVYTIGILDFVFDDDVHDLDKYYYKIKMTDIETQKTFYDKLTFIYLEMPKFKKTLNELENHFEKWMYVFNNLEKLESYPAKLQEKIFESFFEQAALSKLDREGQRAYESSLKYYRDLNNSIDTAKEEGREEGREEGEAIGIEKGEAIGIEKGEAIGIEKGKEEGREEGKITEKIAIAKNLLSKNFDLKNIAEITGLSIIEIKKIK